MYGFLSVKSAFVALCPVPGFQPLSPRPPEGIIGSGMLESSDVTERGFVFAHTGVLPAWRLTDYISDHILHFFVL